jgi:glutamate synthase (NADPH) small chain
MLHPPRREATVVGELGAFLKIHRENGPKRPVSERVHDFREFQESLPVPQLQEQGARCMECGVPFCHQGCPLGNLIPDWNDLVYRDRWREAIDQLHATNNFPEFTGRICPAPCEAACVLDINDDPVTIKAIEVAIADRAFAEGWVKPRPPAVRSGKSVAVIGSGPAGLAAAAELNQFGHTVTLYERNDRIGGLLRYGVPDFKLDKGVVQRRVDILAEEGIDFRTGVDVGRDITGGELQERFDAVVIATGATVPRDLPVTGRELDGVHFAMEYLEQRNRFVAGEFPDGTPITAAGKHVVIIGGGDTGADCLGNSHRESPASVTQFELLPEPPPERPDDRTPWPQWPMILRTSAAHEEGGERRFSVMTTAFEGEGGRVRELRGHEVGEPPSFDRLEGSEFSIPADLVLLAMGFLHPQREGLLEQLGVELDPRGNVATDDYASSAPGVFACGDARRGQSLIVWAIAEGRQAARAADRHLHGLDAEDLEGEDLVAALALR